jgi:hypothetical protein
MKRVSGRIIVFGALMLVAVVAVTCLLFLGRRFQNHGATERLQARMSASNRPLAEEAESNEPPTPVTVADIPGKMLAANQTIISYDVSARSTLETRKADLQETTPATSQRKSYHY